MNSVHKSASSALALCVLFVAGVLLGVSCRFEEPTLSCEDRRPEGYGRTCSEDGECATSLKCIGGECVLPPTMSGEPESTSVELAFRPAPGEDPYLTYQAEQAATELERTRGLSQRACMQEGWAMLFFYPNAGGITHQTREMRYNIDIAFISEQGIVELIVFDVEPGNVVSIDENTPAKYVIETPAEALRPVSPDDFVTWE